MTMYSSDPDKTTDSTDHSAKEKATAATSAATDEGRHVAGTARDEVLDVAGTAAEQARNVVGEARHQVTSQLNDQATTQRDHLSQALRTFGDDLHQMVEQGPGGGIASDLAREVSDRARALGSHLEGREPGQLLDDARDFARRRPGTFLLGALAAGVVAGRLFRATADGAAAASLAETGSTATTGTAPGTGPTGAASASAAPADGPAGYTAPIPSLDEHTGAGYGTGPGGTGGLDDTLDTDVGADTSKADTSIAGTPAASRLPGQRTVDTP
jgi:hypothetical protein